jgi:putative ABC transport system permease protein
VAGALIVAQLIPAAPGAVLGIPAGLGLIAAVAHRQGGATTLPVPPGWWLALMVAGLLAALAAMTAIPARASSRQSPAEILQAESVTG